MELFTYAFWAACLDVLHLAFWTSCMTCDRPSREGFYRSVENENVDFEHPAWRTCHCEQ